MAAPSLISWDTNNANVLIPDAGHIANGWAPLEKPTCNNHNWLFQNIMQWIAYSSVVATADFSASTTWTWNHNLNRPHITLVLDASGGVGGLIQPDTITYGLNTDIITFAGNQAGSVVAR